MDNGLLPIGNYIMSQYEFNCAKLQHDYGLTYIETKRIILKMLYNADIIYRERLTYLVMPNSRQNKKAKVSDNEQFLHACLVCII